MQITQHFSYQELTHSDTAKRLGLVNTPNEAELANIRYTAQQLEAIRAYVQRAIVLTSCFRSEKVNRAVGGSATSAHRLGLAADCHTMQKMQAFEPLANFIAYLAYRFILTPAHRACHDRQDTIMAYTQAPLPFIGQKRRFLRPFKQILDAHLPHDGDGWTIIDVFGGSGLLSHTAKQHKPKARVIYNDFDGYTQRLAHIDDTNRLRQIIFDLTRAVSPKQKLPKETQQRVQSAIQSFDGYIDVACVASWLTFSGRQIGDLTELLTESNYYNRVRLSDYPNANDYLQGVETVSLSYEHLLPQWIGQDKVLFLFDPPYVCTEQSAYHNANYFGMMAFLKLMHMVRPPFIFFSSTRSEFVAYLDFIIANKRDNWQYFENYRKISVQVSLSKRVKYEDNLVYRFD